MLKRILGKRLVPAATVENDEEALMLAEAMLKGGLDVIEITFRTAGAESAIRAIAKRFPEIALGAGTVLTAEQLDSAQAAGACYAVAPGLNEALVTRSLKTKLLFIPGVATATEIDHGIRLGCSVLKFFPAENMGGVDMIKALSGPYAHTGVKFLPTGGINLMNAKAYLALPIVGAVGGSWMVSPKLVKEKKWTEITRLCAEAVALAKC
jgi:2-dehydro-3-deoxyphosphogluconate aldolase / (4S)-4-hydroxy-2-oxoglutarate aldolase